MAFDEVKYKNDFARQNYDRINLILPKGKAAKVKDCAKDKGMSVNALLIKALESAYGLDLSK